MEGNGQLSAPVRDDARDEREREEPLRARVPSETENVREIEECGKAEGGVELGGQAQPRGERSGYGCSIASSMSITGMSLTIG